jgi:hypothetical protein
MENKIMRFLCIPVYIVYLYLLGWQIYYFNNVVFYNKDLREANGNFLRCIPAIVLLLYGLLLYGNLILRQKKLLVFNSLFGASLLFLYETTSSMIMATMLSFFALVIAAFELKRSENGKW